MRQTTLSRRLFLQAAGTAGASLVLGCRIGSASALNDFGIAPAEFEPNAFIRIDSDGKVTLIAPRPEVGTGVRTSLPMLLAEELGVDWRHIAIEQADAGSKFGSQNIGGSQSVQSSYQPLRFAAATAATMLKEAAAQKWGVQVDQCVIEDGVVLCRASGKKAPIGSLVAAAAARPIPDKSSVKLKPPSEFKVIGKPTKRVDTLQVVTGKATYGLDCRVPGMRFAVIVRPHAFGTQAASFDDSACHSITGFVKAFKVQGGAAGVAVVGQSTWSAMKAAEALKVKWDEGPNWSLDTAQLTSRFKMAVKEFPATPSDAVKTIDAVYELPYLSHAPMEPMNCTAIVGADKCEVWAPTQVPGPCLSTAANVSGLPESKVTVHLPLTGGGFGRRLSTEYVAECVEIAKTLGEPVQLLWTRTDDLQHDHYRPMNYHAMRGSVGQNGMPAAVFHQLLEAGGGRGGGGEWTELGGSYDLRDAKLLFGRIASPVPNGAWRSVANTYLGFVRECFFDELCVAGGRDPVEARLALLRNDRTRRTLKLAAEKAGWGTKMKPGWGRGVACFAGFGSFVTQIAEVEVVGGKARVHRVVAAVDCGTVVNPLGLSAQIEGATMDAVATVLHAAITIDKGGAAETNWHEFRWAKMEDAPIVEVYPTTETEQPGGAGEIGYPAAVAAIGNAIFAATGKRIRRLPIAPGDLA